MMVIRDCVSRHGRVGILKDWLTQAYRQALHESASTLRERHWQPYAPSISKCIQIAAEAIEGEKAFQFESGELSLLRQKLGLSEHHHQLIVLPICLLLLLPKRKLKVVLGFANQVAMLLERRESIRA